MSDRQKLSGYQSKKKKLLKEEREKNLLSKIPKIQGFFKESPTISSRSDEPQVIGDGELVIVQEDGGNLSGQNARVREVGVESTDQSVEQIFHPGPANESVEDVEIVFELNEDPALWKCDDSTRDFVAIHGVKQNMDMDFSSSKNVYPDKTRYVPLKLFKRRMKNGESQPRSWLIFSKSKGAVFCTPCYLFGQEMNCFTGEGFRDWKNATARIEGHENSFYHRTNVSSLKARGNVGTRLENALIQQMNEEISYWRNVLRRVVAVVKSLAGRGLPFRGDIEQIGNPHNGNFLASMELIAQFDPFLAKHLQSNAHVGSGRTSYLLKTVYEEFIILIHDQLLNEILTEGKHSKYFGISVDSTPDIAHVDQLTFIIRYVTEDGEPVERFIAFIANSGHKAEQLTDSVLNALRQYDLNIQNCRGQSYDNASNMAGSYTGLQTRIRNLNPLADYIPCAAFINVVTMGTIIGWPMIALPQLLSSNSSIIMTRDEGAWVASGVHLGTIVGCFLSGLIIDKCGAKRTIMVSLIPSLIGWIILGLSTTFWELLLGRFILGYVNGIGYMPTVIYLSELADVRVRGRMGSMISITCGIGVLLSISIGPYFSLATTAWLNLIPPIMSLTMIYWAPESPYWYSKKEMYAELKQSLIVLRRTENVQEEMEVIESYTRNVLPLERRSFSWSSMRYIFPRGVNRKGLYLSLLTIAAQQFSGIQGINTYAVLIFEGTDSSLEGRYVAMLIGFIELVCTLISSLTTDTFGRKSLIMISAMGSASCMAILGIYFHLKSIGIDLGHFQLLPIAAVLLFTSSYGLGLSSVPTVFMGECIPMELRATGIILLVWTFSFVGLAVTKLWQVVTDSLGVQWAFGMFSLITYVNAIILLFSLPETKGKTFSEIQEIMAGGRCGRVKNGNVLPSTEINNHNEQLAMLELENTVE